MSMFDLLLGRPLASQEEHNQKVGVFAGLPMLGLDGLASAAYGPEAALTTLIPLGVGGIAYGMPLIGIIVAILLVLYFSYRQTIAAYPTGGGSYTVARENLGVIPGLIAAAALMLDYVLVAAVGISAGVGALISAVPELQPYILHLGIGILIFITLVNLRGVKESGLAFALPTYLFVGVMFLVLIIGITKTLFAGGNPIPLDAPPVVTNGTVAVSLWLLMRAFSSGCTAMTGVEAVSNGVTAFAQPTIKNAQKTLTAIVVILALMLLGIAYLANAYGIAATAPGTKDYESIVSQLAGAIVGKGFLYYVVIGSTLAVLALSANTGFADFPRLCRLLAEDDYLPHVFASRGRRLVYSIGIIILAVFAGLLLILFGGITDHLIPLFAVGAFMAFTLSQAGMVKHWLKVREGKWKVSTIINGLGAVATGLALIVVLAAKFVEGAWITCLILPLFVITFMGVKRHYLAVRRETRLKGPMAVAHIRPPLVIVPIKGLNTIAAKAIQFAVSISPDVTGLHISTSEAEAEHLKDAWCHRIAEPLQATGTAAPELVVLSSPYRRLFHPLIDYVREVLEQNPDRSVTVVIPELVEARWWQYLLHNQRATGLKAALLLHGGHRVIVMNVPWYLEAEQTT